MTSWTEEYVETFYVDSDSACWIFVCEVMRKQFNIEMPNLISTTDREITQRELRKHIESDHWLEVYLPREGDIVVANVIEESRPHIGIMLDSRRMVHYWNAACSVCIEDVTKQKWANRVSGFYRHVSAHN